MNRKRGEGLSLKGGKGGVRLCSEGAALRSFGKEENFRNLQPFLSIFRSRARESQYDIYVGFSNQTKDFFFSFEKAQSHTLTSMMGTPRRSNEKKFSALLYLEQWSISRELHS